MTTMTRERSSTSGLDPLRTVPIVLIALFLVLAAVDLLLALQPALLRSLRSSWESLAPAARTASPLPTLLAATVAISGIALSATLLAAFMRAVRRAPFGWLTPSLIGLWSIVISGFGELPLPVSTALFAGAGALLLAGGGVLLQQRARNANRLGVLLIATPLLLLLGAYVGSPHGFDRNAGVLLLTQVLISVAVASVAWLSRRGFDQTRQEVQALIAEERAQAIQAAATTTLKGDDARVEGLQARLREALHGVASSEARALQAEQRARSAEQRAQGAALAASSATASAPAQPILHLDGDAPDFERQHRSKAPLIWLSLIWLGVCGVLSYFALYAPLQKRLLAQQTLIRRGSEQKEREIAALHARLDLERNQANAQRDQLTGQLEELRQTQTAAPAAASGRSSLAAMPSGDSHASSGTGEHPLTWRERRALRLAAAAAATAELSNGQNSEASGTPATAPTPSSPTKKSSSASSRSSRSSSASSKSSSASDSESAPAKAAPASRANSSTDDDDPIGGLDGI